MPEQIQALAQPITEDDATIARHLEQASVGALLMSIIHLTGDASLLDGPIRPGPAVLGEQQGSLSEGEQATVRARALEALAAHRDRGCVLPPPPDRDTVHRMMSFLVGEHVPDAYVPMMLEEMALDGADARRTDLAQAVEAAGGAAPKVLVIGAGMSGLLAAIRLKEAGVEFLIVEKNAGVGGTWYENDYPGSRVDIGNHFYCYSFAPNHGWSEYFSRQPELRAYFEDCADRYGVAEAIEFETEVVSLRWDEDGAYWRARLRKPTGETRETTAHVVVSAVGQLNRPFVPALPGLERFEGPAFHSARFEHEHDLTGKRVALIGTGASALQLAPELAKTAGRLYVVQRSPAWMTPNPRYHAKVGDGAKWLLEHVPYYARWFRFLIFWPGSDGLMPSLEIDPEWPHPERSVNALNDATRAYFTAYIESQLEDRPDLVDKVVPSYPPFVKRMLQDNGSWLATLKRDDVELVADAAERVEPDAIVCRDGRRLEVDVIVFATGFEANRFLAPIEVVGREGRVLAEVWGDDPGAYLGITMPGFPNLYCLYGPGTNLAHAGSIIFHSECQVRYVMSALEAMVERGERVFECRRDVFDDYIRRMDARHAELVWSHPGASSWYKNAKGRVTTTSPWRLVDYWRWTRAFDPADYDSTRSGPAAGETDPTPGSAFAPSPDTTV